MGNIENCGQEEADEEREDVQPGPRYHHSGEEREERDHLQDENQNDVQSPDSARALTVQGRHKSLSHHKPSQFEKVPTVRICMHALNYKN